LSILDPFPNDTKCFELTEAAGLLLSLVRDAKTKGIAYAMSFLPAPLTWLEMDVGGGRLVAIYLRELKEQLLSELTYIEANDKYSKAVKFPPIQLLSDSDPDEWAITATQYVIDNYQPPSSREDTLKNVYNMVLFTYSALAVINSPRIVGRVDNQPMVKLSKDQGKRTGQPYRLLPWHRVQLNITPSARDGGDPARTLSGPRALHYCRQHLRIKRGKLEYVRGHFRGDAAVGISRSYYSVTDGAGAAQPPAMAS
jgi:hypothetical protein